MDKLTISSNVFHLKDINHSKIALDSYKKDLIDWCKADRKKWLNEPLNSVYAKLYVPTRNSLYDKLSEEQKKFPFGIDMNVIKNHAMIRYNIERVKKYGTREAFIKEYGIEVYNTIFRTDKNSKLDLSWEGVCKAIEKGFD